MSSTLDYNALVQNALRGVVRRALESVAAHGLPGQHHFYITYATDAPGVRLADALKSEYPEEITIVLQHEYRDLDVDAEGFAVTLRFSGLWRRVVVPFSAVLVFSDPSVQFLLRFETFDDELANADASGTRAGGDIDLDSIPIEKSPEEMLAAEPDEAEASSDTEDDSSGGTADVVSIDRFRRR